MHQSVCGGEEAHYNKKDAMSHYVGLLVNRLAAVKSCLAFPVSTTNCGLQATGKDRHRPRDDSYYPLLYKLG